MPFPFGQGLFGDNGHMGITGNNPKSVRCDTVLLHAVLAYGRRVSGYRGFLLVLAFAAAPPPIRSSR
jgi:hypothetical protein